MPHVPILLQSAPIDISGIGQSIVNAIQGAMPQLATSAAQASVPAIQSTAPVLATSAGQSVTTGGSGLIDALQSNPLNVLTSTPPGLTYANGVVQQLQAVTLTAALAAASVGPPRSASGQAPGDWWRGGAPPEGSDPQV